MGAIRDRIPGISGESRALAAPEATLTTPQGGIQAVNVASGLMVVLGIMASVGGVVILTAMLGLVLITGSTSSAPLPLVALGTVSLGLGVYYLKSGRQALRKAPTARKTMRSSQAPLLLAVLIGIAADGLQDTFSSGVVWVAVAIAAFFLERRVKRLEPSLSGVNGH